MIFIGIIIHILPDRQKDFKQALRLYANKKDFKNDARLYQSLGRHGEKLSTLDFAEDRNRDIEQETELRPSFLSRVKSFFTRDQEPKQHQPDTATPEHQYSGQWIETPDEPTREEEQNRRASARPLDQQDFVKLRDEFLQKARMAEAQHTIEQEPQPHNIRSLER